MRKVRVGLIGAGKIGQIHANNLLQSDYFYLKTIADVYIDHLKGTHFEQRVPNITQSPEEIFGDEEIDAVFICSLTHTHAEYIMKAAKAGKHIFCEKPISLDIEQTKEAFKVVKETGVKLQVGFNRRFDKHFRKVSQFVQQGKIGKPHLIKISSRDPQPPPEEYLSGSGGMFIDMTIHDFDMVRFLAGSEVKDITVKAANLVHPIFSKYMDVDTAVITMTLENGALAVIDNSRQAAYGYDQRIEVFGSKGSVEAENETETNVKLSTEESVSLDHPKYFFLERYKEAYATEANEFAKAILSGVEVACSGEDGLKAEILAVAARQSWLEERTVTISEIEKSIQLI